MTPTENELIIVTGRTRSVVIVLQKIILFVTRYWLLIACLLAWLILALGFLAPVFMAEGMTGAGQWAYDFLAPHNHQLPQRSYFLFGETGVIQTYSVEQLIDFDADPRDLEAFIGNAEIGYKTALNHRMIAIFAAIVIGGLGWGLAGGRPKISFLWLVILALPLLADGISHMISDNGGSGFRQSNTWAIALTGGFLPASFYQGTIIGTLNWWLRNVTGALFGLGLAWFLFTYLSVRFAPVRAKLEPKLRRIGAVQ